MEKINNSEYGRMDVIDIPYEQLDSCYQGQVDEGYHWGCQCGEGHETRESAENCRKCRKYLEDFPSQVYYTPPKRMAV